MRPEPVTVDGREGVVVFLNAARQPVESNDPAAVLAKVLFDDGGIAFAEVKPSEYQLGGAGSGNFGHAGRPGEVGGSAPGEGGVATARETEAGYGEAREFTGNEGYDWHERPEMEAYAQGLPADEVRSVADYASFSYADVNSLLRGTFDPKTVNETVREATPEEIAAFKHPPFNHGQHASDYDESDPLNKVADGRIVHDFHYKDGYKPDGPNERVDTYTIEKAGPDEKYVKQITGTAERINTLIRERGYVLEEPITVNRAAYIPGLSYADLKAMEGSTIEEKGFTSTMLGNPGGRLDAYVVGGKSESLYKRFADAEGSSAIYDRQDEVGSSMRIKIVLPEGTKVAPVETLRRIEHVYPPKPVPPEYADDPYWKANPDKWIERDRTAQPTSVNTEMLHDTNKRSEAEILLGSGAQFRVVSVQRSDKRIVSSDPKLKPVEVTDVVLEYIGGGSSEG